MTRRSDPGGSVREAAAAAWGVPAEQVAVEPLAGDASDRRFFRARRPDGATLVVMQLAEGREAPADPDRLPYLNVRTHLALCGVAVPALHRYDPGAGLVVLEDLGAETLQDHVRRRGPEACLPLYREALRQLVLLQVVGTRKACGHCVAFHRRFDEDKLMSELDFFLRHTVEGHLGRAVPPDRGRRIRGAMRELCRTIAAEPAYLAHRDYHSRNLVVRDGRVGLVDFQDARLGPLQYDLCSLLRDAYVTLRPEIQETLEEHYLDLLAEQGLARPRRERFDRILDLVTVQRSLKAAGTFGYMAAVKGRPAYLQSLPPALAAAGHAMARQPELSDLRRELGAVLPEVL